MSKQVIRKKLVFEKIFLLIIFVLTACASSPPEHLEQPTTIPRLIIHDDFIIVKTTDTDTLSSLAQKYLNDPAKDRQIAEFNGIDSLTAGQELVIPLYHLDKGGLKTTGYQTVPVLLYQRFTKNNPGKMTVGEAAFEEQMKYIKSNGYNVITLDQLLNFLDFKEEIPKKSVVITFDDGWRSIYDIAFPILKNYGFPATLFVYTDFIGGRKAMSWKQIKELSENGFDIQCKTKTHRDLAKLKNNESFKDYFESIKLEISYPKKLIKQRLGIDCSCLAYPYGKTNNLVITILKKHGYRAAFTVKRGGNPFFVDMYKIRRSLIYSKFSIEQFKKTLSVFHKVELK